MAVNLHVCVEVLGHSVGHSSPLNVLNHGCEHLLGRGAELGFGIRTAVLAYSLPRNLVVKNDEAVLDLFTVGRVSVVVGHAVLVLHRVLLGHLVLVGGIVVCVLTFVHFQWDFWLGNLL